MKTTLIEKRSQAGMYDIGTESMILDTNTHGRLLVTDGWGGSEINGYCYHWRHGLVAQLKTDDTFETLDQPWNEYTGTINAIMTGNDPERPLLDWPSFAIVDITADFC
jgi:hypothetical protein